MSEAVQADARVAPAAPPPACPAAAPPPAAWSIWRMAIFLACVLVGLFAVQVAAFRVADWMQFSFYDAGTTLKGDMLLAKGYVPTRDFGYTHGLLPLVFGRVGFAVLGRTPWGYLALTMVTELVMAWCLARVIAALRMSWAGVAVLIAALPMAIFPAYLTLTHPLEAMLILLALADHAEGKRSRALAVLTVCLFVKPSMAYVYGAVLVAVICWRERFRAGAILRAFVPAMVVGVVVGAALAMWAGAGPLVATVVPTTGMRTYAAFGFGFFSPQGRAFWMLPGVWEYLVTPVGMYLVAAVTCAGGAVLSLRAAGGRVLSRWREGAATWSSGAATRWEILGTVGILHTAFLLGFYGWSGSWSYYSYLAILGVVIAIEMIPGVRKRRSFAAIAIVLFLASHVQLAGAIYTDWRWKHRVAGGLWAYEDMFREWNSLVAEVGDAPTLVLTHGWIATPANVQLPDAWFPELGIPTESELERIRVQVAGSRYIIRWKAYRAFEDVWNARELEGERGAFEKVVDGKYFTLWRRR